ncbi:thioredoxin-disulfide reductase [Commensalibacter nepenthis]|uniref:Thioredoxin reductase n=1 Tax=Commensalibacter nepenthis TaxID=3043872 RepID=A0ABT6Q7Z1_9PROT|nr:thioredoxin-disulfide reductase [Commensalibacter sp. TBRC 10068]MDI2112485.1 thioredoxin-disulfide reductase [Commensalibacter sp. TBRC 10068]
MTEVFITNMLIIGAGPAGYTAAIYGARANMKPVLLTGMQPGGQLTITNDVENFPGFADAIQGPWLMEQMAEQAKNVGAEIVMDSVTKCSLLGPEKEDEYFIFHTDSGNIYKARTAIIATGAQARWLGLEAEEKLQGYGVSACATCDGFFYRGKKVAVIGGGNTAVEEALYLTHHASHVTLIHRRDSLRAEKIQQDRLLNNPKVSVIWDSVVENILSGGTPEAVTGLALKNVKTNEQSTLDIDGVFIAIGHNPNTSLFKNQLDLDSEGYIITQPGTPKTSIPGIFAAGDVQDKTYRQAITAAGSGCMAALDAERFISEIE